MHVLFPAQKAVELHHRLVDRHIMGWVVTLPKVLLAEGDQWTDLRQLVVPVFVPWQRAVEVLAGFLIPCTRQYAGDEGVMQVLIPGKVLDTQCDVDTDESLDLIGSHRMPVWVICVKIAIRSISTVRSVHAKDHKMLKLSKNKLATVCVNSEYTWILYKHVFLSHVPLYL